MASKFENVRQTHVSPGIYTKETELFYASKSLGITTLGVAGETVKGPAFQPILVENWRDYQRYFGGTNPEKFKGSQYPKYELPYIAQSYLKQSNQLQVVRVLGLSGVNAGPAWVITAGSDDNSTEGCERYQNTVVAVIRSRGEHQKSALIADADPTAVPPICEDVYEYDPLIYYAKEVWLEPSNSMVLDDQCSPSYTTEHGDFRVDQNNYGRFTICVLTYQGEIKRYSVSLNPGEKNYIYNVIGGDPERGETEVYVEELYDVALKQLIEMGCINEIHAAMNYYQPAYIVPKFEAVDGLVSEPEEALRRKDVGKRFLYSKTYSKDRTGAAITVHNTSDGRHWEAADEGTAGVIYTVVAHTTESGKREYYYGCNTTKIEQLSAERTLVDSMGVTQTGEGKVENNVIFENAVKSIEDDVYYVFKGEDVEPVAFDMNNYKEEYRYASTPWVVSEVKGSGEHIEVTKLFRFHTISDGNSANTEIKVSIENIDPEKGTFDVLVRDFYDTDEAKSVIERYRGVNLVPGNQNYIALRIGSFDEKYVNVSNYISVEVNETDTVAVSTPCGFLGYPVRNYDKALKYTGGYTPSHGSYADNESMAPANPYLRYHTNVYEDIRISKQYFGISDIVGIDSDMFKYKGFEAYKFMDVYTEGISPCFHLDARILNGKPQEDAETGEWYVYDESNNKQCVSVDGVSGYEWVTVGKNNVTDYGIEPRMGNEDDMLGTIYEDKRYRKFTMAFYGGFDGWDYYRKSRSNSDDFKWNKYRGKINWESGEGTNFSVIRNPENYGFNKGEKAITSDWYAYMSAIRQFANPKDIDINVLATPGIDYVNNNTLVGDVIEMVEDERADTIYVVTTPDKPYGAGDSVSEMYNAEAAVMNLEDAEIDSNYTCSYYPWVKYFDTENSVYLYLPPTRDVVRNFAYTDNTKYPWFAAAGWNRGDLETTAVKPKKTLKLEEQDTLYDGRLNFVNTFANEGMKIWGDKNMQEHESQMNRISKRRLLLHIRKLCAIAAIGLIFDPNDNTTSQSFRSAVTPVLDNVMANRGITDWRLELDESQEARDRLELPAIIYIKPLPNLEYITISFVVTPSGVSFDDI